VVPPEANDKHRDTSYLGGVKKYLKSFLGLEQLEVSKSDNAMTDTEGRSKATKEEKSNLWMQVYRFVGMDPISMLSLPIWIFEPTTFLQRMAEPFVYADYLYRCSESEDPLHRLLMLAAFNVSIVSLTERSGKPFNPILGETFEYVSPRGFKYLAEQVSHHPPIGVAETQCDSWRMKQEAHVSTKFHGNSIEIFAIGDTHLIINKTDEQYSWPQPNSFVHNILVGGMWIEYWGEVEIKSNLSKGEKCVLKFHKAGWFGDRRAVSGHIIDAEGKTRYNLNGKWNQFLTAKVVGKDGKEFGEDIVLWQRSNEDPDNKWKIPSFTLKELCAIDPTLEKIIPPGDSRFRPDRRALEMGDIALAGKEKSRIEEKQRRDRLQREKNGEKFVSKNFRLEEDPDYGHRWTFNGEYWIEREKRVAELQASSSATV